VKAFNRRTSCTFFAQADISFCQCYEVGALSSTGIGCGLPVICSDAVGAGTDLVEEM
jgi:hypothetical protein